MGGKDANRPPQVSTLRNIPHGWIRVAACNNWSHKGPLPVDRLVRKHGELAIVEVVLVGLKCSNCSG
jgi:hypothetical protein